MVLKNDAKSEEKLTCAFKNDMRNLAIFTRALESLKIGILWYIFIQSIKYMTLKFTGELCVMTMKNDGKFKQELTFQFKIDKGNLTKFDLSTEKSQTFAL